VIAGDGPQRAATAKAIHRAGLNHRVQLVGRLSRPEIMRLLAQADVFLAPARLEAFGIAALEARYAGLPVVAMRDGGVGEFVQDGRHGYLVADDREMALRTVQLLAYPQHLRRIGGCSLAEPPDLGWETVVEQSLDTYRVAGAVVPFQPKVGV